QLARDEQEIRAPRDLDHGREGRDGVVRHLERRRPYDEVGGDAEKQRVAVGRCARHRSSADGAARTGLVLDDDVLAEPLGEGGGELASEDVRTASGWKAVHERDGTDGEILRLRSAGEDQ